MTQFADSIETHPHGLRFVDDEGRCLACLLAQERERAEVAEDAVAASLLGECRGALEKFTRAVEKLSVSEGHYLYRRRLCDEARGVLDKLDALDTSTLTEEDTGA